MNKFKNILLVSLFAVLPAATLQAKGSSEFAHCYQNVPFKMPEIKRPNIPGNEINIADFGGKNDGRTLNTEVFAKAMRTLKEKGGGRIIVPSGIWLTGPIEFENNTELHLEVGALLFFTDDRSQYPLVDSYYEGLSSKRCKSPLTAFNKHDIAITGHGSIDGNGQAWRPVKKMKLTEKQWQNLTKSGGTVNEDGKIWYISKEVQEISEDPMFFQNARISGSSEAWDVLHDYLRPVMVNFVGCKNILLEDASFENSPAWNIHPNMCENLIINNVQVRNPWYAQNGDGLDIESCKNVLVVNSSFDVGDDAICIKSGRDKEGRERGIPTENVIIYGNTVYHGHGGFVIGSEMSGGARNILVRNCMFTGTDVGLRFKSTRGRGGVIENIWCDNVNMTSIEGEAVIFDLFYSVAADDPVPPASVETPDFHKIYISNVTCQNAKKAIKMNGLPELPLYDIYFKDCYFHAKYGAEINQVKSVTLENTTIENEKGQRITQRNTIKIIEK